MNNFIAFDFETANGNYPCSIGIVEFQDGEVINEYYSLINPKIDKFNPFAKRVHGISEEQVANEREFDEVWKDINHFFEGRVIVAHNSSFDMSVLYSSLERYNIPMPINTCFCTLSLSRSRFQLDNYKLSSLAQYFKIPQENYHNALEDAFICGKVFFHILLQVEDFELFTKSNSFLKNKNKKLITNNTKKTINFNNDSTLIINVKELLSIQSDILKGQSIVISGVFESLSRDELKKLIEDNGGKVSSSISSKTSFIVAGDNMGPSKRKKAEDLNILLINEYEFLQKIK
ncbi:exonuclease domain-containing protein [Mariniflexile sp. HNIBRBA6329]|uniref:3'-5' exonuclease n=1 Tax=Mariniflexile sp. HNIBRBA6329 TaxID=3373088 RepID=UPI00374555BE